MCVNKSRCVNVMSSGLRIRCVGRQYGGGHGMGSRFFSVSVSAGPFHILWSNVQIPWQASES